MDTNASGPSWSALSDGLGPLPEPYMFLPHSDGPMPLYRVTDLQAAVEADRERLIEILRNKMQDLDNKGQCVAAQAFDLAIVLLKRGY